MYVSELATLIWQTLGRENLTVDDIYRCTDIKGKHNKHLVDVLNLTDGHRVRTTPLTGMEQIYGEYLLFDYCGHNGDMFLDEYESLEEVEAHIVGEAGITNAFTTYLVAIINGKIKPYQIYYRDEQTRGLRLFNKDEQLNSPDPFRSYKDVQVHWLN